MNFVKIKYAYLDKCVGILNHKEIKMNDTDRLLYGYIIGMYVKTGVFFAGDKKISAVLKKPVSTISKHLRRLEAFGWIERQTSPISYGGKSRIIVPFKHLGDPKPNVPKDESHNPKVDIPIKDIRVVNKSTINKSSDKAISPDLKEKLKSKYATDKPWMDIDAMADKVTTYYQGKGVPLGVKLQEWCQREDPPKDYIAGIDHSAVIKRAIEKFGIYKSNKARAYCREHGDADTSKIIKNIGWGILCGMDIRYINNKDLLERAEREADKETLSKNGYSGNKVNKGSVSIGDAIGDYLGK